MAKKKQQTKNRLYENNEGEWQEKWQNKGRFVLEDGKEMQNKTKTIKEKQMTHEERQKGEEER